ncbi:helix-turn-helix domain-containing protein [Galbibacter mesophilus]|uniref:helix-turn-helix domain-containing protein n=1 Tax=Galbibacter mesophilus TaxID=379069 RepID=UPI00191E1FD3|nr:helix-turn-helix transcriptional regulator [Galbibacter mesophilus]MCM5663352.1 helix-turn-helix domain-containing protein [Galbibacter mesophilus]
MVNKEDFIKRLEKVIDYYDLSASAFADKIGVQRSSISHLLSGRNNPSLDFVMRILENFPEVELYWLLNGKGNFPETSTSSKPPKLDADLFSSEEVTPSTSKEIEPSEEVKNETTTVHAKKSDIARIVVFYKNGTFEEYKNLP